MQHIEARIGTNRSGWSERFLGEIAKLASLLTFRNRGRSPLIEAQRPAVVSRFEHREDNPGVIPIHLDNGDVIVAFMGRSYLEHLPYLLDTATDFLQRNTQLPSDFCRDLTQKGMEVEELVCRKNRPFYREDSVLDEQMIATILQKKEKEAKIPSVFLWREDKAPKGHYLGISVQRKRFINIKPEETVNGVAKEVTVLEHVLRVFEPDYRGRHRGRLAVELALVRHGGAMYYIHKTGSPLAAYTNTQSELLRQEDAHPWRGVVILDPEMQLVREKTKSYFLFPGEIMRSDGVIPNSYPGPNKGFDVAQLRGGALAMFNTMTDEKGLNMHIVGDDPVRTRYDSIVPLYRVK